MMESASKKPTSLGTITLKQELITSSEIFVDVQTLIDNNYGRGGEQNLLTNLNIFFKVLCLKTGNNYLFDRHFRAQHGKFALWHNNSDSKFISSFQTFVELKELGEIERYDITDNIIGAYKFFENNVNPDKLDSQTILNNGEFSCIKYVPNY